MVMVITCKEPIVEGTWIERPGPSSESKSLKEQANFIVCPDSLAGEVNGTFRLRS